MSASTVSASPVSTARAPRSRRRLVGWFILPATAFLLVFFAYPLGNIIWRSLTEPSTGLENYTELLKDGVSVKILVRTLVTGLIVAACTLVLAYPYAYAMTRVSPRTRNLMTVVVLLPFWTSMMARNFAWYMLEQRDGLIDDAFSLIGIDGVVLLGSVAGVTVAMVQVMLPFMVLPLYSGMEGIDKRLLNAAGSLGAPRWRAFVQVYLPLSLPAVLSGFTLVFILTLGFYVTPALLGSPQQSLIPQLIATRVNDLLDFGGAGALGSVLLVVTLLALFVVSRFVNLSSTTEKAVTHE
ncbi:putative spermidine/putrescine transport system permease protein [Actinomadura pelletieri DSM 43383]|uniref:Putative spermidine/putrescine transport system permease protein n=1 Tax=Actinomadura pelletieri DSM 43383 TaxID=1120940 RepID=A0A495QTY2_9ACTN|nr:putative spermidine/putrescine transport system permease protein [Actinomadura pelletieri DSM 43383]